MLNKVKYRNNAFGFNSAAKKIILLCVLFVFVGNLFAQKPKPAKEKPPTAAEMKKMLADAQKQLDNMDPATKRMMDSMGVKMPGISNEQKKGLEKVTDKQIANAYEDANRIVPKKNATKIAKANSIKLNRANLSSYIQSVQNAVIAKMTPKQKKEVEDLLAYLKSQNKNANGISLAASGCMMENLMLHGLYLMSKACLLDLKNEDNLNNYASFLIMSSCSENAIPILNLLNQEIPKSSIVLNNLGQAWFCLGAIDIAEINLTSCLNIDNKQPQANETMSSIAQSKGNIAMAKKYIQNSLDFTYSREKEIALEKLGDKLSTKNPPLNMYIKDDALGLNKFTYPKSPRSIEDVIEVGNDWNALTMKVSSEMEMLKNEQAILSEKIKEETINNEFQPSFNTNIYYKQAHRLIEGENAKYEKLISVFREALQNKIVQIEKKYKSLSEENYKQFIEYKSGKYNREACEGMTKIINEYLSEINSAKERLYSPFIKDYKIILNNMLHYQIYMVQTDKQRLGIENQMKLYWLSIFPNKDNNKIGSLGSTRFDAQGINDVDLNFANLATILCSSEKETKPAKGDVKPINFLEADCPEIEWDFGIYKITEKCGYMKGNYSLGPIKLDLEKDASSSDFFTKGSLEVSLTGIKDMIKGRANVKVNKPDNSFLKEAVKISTHKEYLSAVFEFNNKQITDFGIKGGVKADIGTNIVPGFNPKITAASIEGKIMWNAGGSVTGGGIFKDKGLDLKF